MQRNAKQKAEDSARGQPLPERTPPPFVDAEDDYLRGVADRMHREAALASHEERAEYRKAALQANPPSPKAFPSSFHWQ